MKRLLAFIFLCVIVDMFYFPVSFTFLPEAINTKIMMGALGGVLYALDCIGKRRMDMSRPILITLLFGLVFALICYLSTVVNNTDDYTYATYYVSFFTWVFSAYGVCTIVKRVNGKVDIESLTWMIAAVCVSQCVIALYIDSHPVFKDVVDSIFVQDQDFLNRVDRLYGIGASLDTAGVRFSIALILLAHQVSVNEAVQRDPWKMGLCMSAFLALILMGNMIARTTIIGAGLGLVYMFISLGISKNIGSLTRKQISFYGFSFLLVTAVVAVSIYLYNSNPTFHRNLRFAFEGFFNWIEQGEWRTNSTDRLNDVMWIWPTTVKEWIIGRGLFEHFVFGTDIGYCRFTLYCGLLGLAAFSLFFVVSAYQVSILWKDTALLAFFLLLVVFIIWMKVSTDIFFIFALLFCTDAVTEKT